MRFCDRCEASIPKTAKIIHTRHNQWLCAPCHDAEVAQLKAQAEAHLRHRGEKPRPAPKNPLPWIIGGVATVAVAAVAIALNADSADALSAEEAQAAFLEWRHGDDLARERGQTAEEREATARERRMRRAEALRTAAEDARYQDVERLLKSELGSQAHLLSTPCALEEDGVPTLLVNLDWHGLPGDEQMVIASTADRVVSAVFGEPRSWTFKDGPFPVGGRDSSEADDIWVSRQELESATR